MLPDSLLGSAHTLVSTSPISCLLHMSRPSAPCSPTPPLGSLDPAHLMGRPLLVVPFCLNQSGTGSLTSAAGLSQSETNAKQHTYTCSLCQKCTVLPINSLLLSQFSFQPIRSHYSFLFCILPPEIMFQACFLLYLKS